MKLIVAVVLSLICTMMGSTFVAYAQLGTTNKTSLSTVPAQQTSLAKLIITQKIVNHGSGKKYTSDFNVIVRGNSPKPNSFFGSSNGTTVILHEGAYNVAENITSGYIPHYSSDCNSTIRAGQTKTCQITAEGITPLSRNFVTTINGPFSGPEALASDPINGDVYVANYGDYDKIGTVSVIDGSRNILIANVSVDNNPTALAYDYYNNNMYVTNLYSNTV